MKVTYLPTDISSTKSIEGISIYPFEAEKHSLKGKGVLETNAISLVISGEKTMRFANKTVSIKDDEFHFLSSGNCLASVELSNKKVFKSILIYFTNKVLADFYLKYIKLIEARRPPTIRHESYVGFKKDTFTENFIVSLKLLCSSNKSLSLEMRSLKFEELMLYLLEKYPEKILSFQTSDRKDLSDFQIRKAVETNLTSRITIQELAFLCNLSLSTFKRKFEKMYGDSPIRWILQKRMEIAKDLLQHHHQKPSEVYHKVGYENHSSFTKSFRQIYGLTPKNFQLTFKA